MREGSLFTGAGGGLYGSRLLGWRTAFMVEQEPYCQRVLRARQADGWFDECPIHGDVFAFDGTPWRGEIDVLSAGFPCQP
jgi:DNA (cytosine-5)-methyltransferase 1